MKLIDILNIKKPIKEASFNHIFVVDLEIKIDDVDAGEILDDIISTIEKRFPKVSVEIKDSEWQQTSTW